MFRQTLLAQPVRAPMKGDLDLGTLEDEQDKQQVEQAADAYKDVLERMQKALGDKVKEVRVSHRLTSSPSCLVLEQQDMAMHMQKILQQAGHSIPASKPILEINPGHDLVRRLQGEADAQRFEDWSHVLFDQAMLSEGGQLEDPAAFVRRLNALLLTLGGSAS